MDGLTMSEHTGVAAPLGAAGPAATSPAGRPFLDYYRAQKIIPVKQDLTDLAAHFKRRAFLYHCLQRRRCAAGG